MQLEVILQATQNLTTLNRQTDILERNLGNLSLTLLELYYNMKKILKNLQKQARKMQKTQRVINSFLNKTYKNYESMKTQLKKIFAVFIFAIGAVSCGTTKVSVNRPDNGTYTQIVVTTNNPISTSTDAKANAQFNGKEQKQ